MAITRRQFIRRGGLVTAGSVLGPQLFGRAFLHQAFAALEDNERYVVILFLDGGNDGLNTVIPADDVGGLRTAYDAARGALNITPAELANSLIGLDPISGTRLALHPALNVPGSLFRNGAGAGGVKALYDLGQVAVIQGCGYPNYNLSHDESRLIWQTGDPLGYSPAAAGWIGRHLAAQYTNTQIPAVNIDTAIVGEFRQIGTNVLALRDLGNFRFPFDAAYPDDIGDPLLDFGKKAWAFRELSQLAIDGGQPSASVIGSTGIATLESTTAFESLTGLYDGDRGTFGQRYAEVGRSAALDLRDIARVIYGCEQGVPDVRARFFQLSTSGYDTHADQGGANINGQQASLHAAVGAALKVFFDDLADMGAADRVTVLIWSEFSRRIRDNGSGTDHGSQGPMFVIGGGVRGGIYGHHPNIANGALDGEGNTRYTQDANDFRATDFRDVYGTIFQHWVNLPQATVEALLPLDDSPEALADPAHYWRNADFDLKRGSDGLDLFA